MEGGQVGTIPMAVHSTRMVPQQRRPGFWLLFSGPVNILIFIHRCMISENLVRGAAELRLIMRAWIMQTLCSFHQARLKKWGLGKVHMLHLGIEFNCRPKWLKNLALMFSFPFLFPQDQAFWGIESTILSLVGCLLVCRTDSGCCWLFTSLKDLGPRYWKALLSDFSNLHP